jgi:hypothetical protein
MDLSKIVSISGRPGLYKLLTETKNGFIVESLSDGKRFPVFASARVSSLEEISIYSLKEDDLSLKEVFKAISEKEAEGRTIDRQAKPDELKEYFGEAIPDYDPEQVYISDIKKVLAWYSLLKEKDLLNFEEEESEGKKEQENTGDGEKDGEASGEEETKD